MFQKLALAALLAFPALAPSVASAADYVIDDSHSRPGFKIQHMTVSWVYGEFGKMSGTLSYDPAKVEDTKLSATIDVASIDTKDADRDEHLRKPDFFDVANHPKLTFESTGVKNVAKDGSFDIVGNLTMRGVTKEMVFHIENITGEITDPWGNQRRGGTATATLNRQDYGVSFSGTLDQGGLMVGDEVYITVDFELIAPAKK